MLVWQDARGGLGKRQSFVDQRTRGVLSHGPQVSSLRSSAGQRQATYLQLWLSNLVIHKIICLMSFAFPAGVLSKGHVRCPWHGACFNIATGDIEDFPGLDSLPVFQVTFPTSCCCLLTHSLPYHVSEHFQQKVSTLHMSVCSRSGLKRTR